MISINLNKIKSYFTIDMEITIDNLIKAYNNYLDCNDFSDLKCPLCGNKTLFFHKTYERNLTYYIDSILKNIKINIIVCKCEHCAKKNAKQKYHALLPIFIFPYAIYESSTILKAISDYLNKIKLKEILERIQINHKLFYDWLKKINKYILSSSIILKCNNNLKVVIKEIMNQNNIFLSIFYQTYMHPFFLFKLTCVKLCIIP